jgi:hypothetical protein
MHAKRWNGGKFRCKFGQFGPPAWTPALSFDRVMDWGFAQHPRVCPMGTDSVRAKAVEAVKLARH